MASPMATRWLWPPERCRGRLCRRSPRPKVSAACRTRRVMFVGPEPLDLQTEAKVLGDRLQTKQRRESGIWRPDGDEFYGTGALYAEWIGVAAERVDDEGVGERVLVPAEASGVERLDDWRGFGQRLIASGTTRVRSVRVDPVNVLPNARTGPTPIDALLRAEASGEFESTLDARAFGRGNAKFDEISTSLATMKRVARLIDRRPICR